MERIAPLAKILAEANGIEWETLQGTGPDGQIVEQDILDYLTRVMSGEAEPPSTPVDAPPPDWDGNDVPGAGMFDAAALSKAGVESDIAEFVSQGRPAGPQIPGTSTPALETSDFELDDQEAVPAPEVRPAAPSEAAAAPAVPEAQPAITQPVPPQPAVAEQQNPSGSMISAPAAPAAATAGGLGSLLSRLYHKDEPAPAPAVAPVAVSAPEMPAPEISATVEVPAPMPQVEPQPQPVVEPVQAMPVQVDTVPAGNTVPAGDTVPAVEPVPAPIPTPPVMAAPAPEPVVPAAPAAAPATAPSTPSDSGPASQVPRDAVWFGTYLRRSANVGHLTDLQGHLAEALERDVPLALLVARAAQRHLDTLDLAKLERAQVAMQDIQSNKARSVGMGQQSGIRDAVAASLSDHEGTPDLLVVDAGQLGLDDLHYPHTLTLSVGRVEDGKASLSLQGDVEAAKAAQFLAKVADTLEKPVILLV